MQNPTWVVAEACKVKDALFLGNVMAVQVWTTPPPFPAPSTLPPNPHALHPTPYIIHPAPYTLHPAPYTLHPRHYTLHPTP